MTDNRTLTQADLRHFTGDLERYRHWANHRVIYTAGIRHMADAGGAHWLVDKIALALGSKPLQQRFATDPRAAEMLFWTLRVNPDASATLVAIVDKGEAPIFECRIDYTDFPLDRADIWTAFDGGKWTLYLPSEH